MDVAAEAPLDDPTFAGTEPPLSLSPVQGRPAGWMAPVLAMRKRSADRMVTPQEGGAGKAVGTSAAGPAAGPGEHTVVEYWRDVVRRVGCAPTGAISY